MIVAIITWNMNLENENEFQTKKKYEERGGVTEVTL